MTIELAMSDRDLGEAFGLAAGRAPERQQLEADRARLFALVAGGLKVASGSAPCPPGPMALDFDTKTSGFFAVVTAGYTCPRTPDALAIEYGLFFAHDPLHRCFARLLLPGEAPRQLVFASSQRRVALALAVSPLRHLIDFITLGIEHIFTGYDHLAFLIGLLLVAVERGRRGLGGLVGVVTAFTVAHSVTLLAAGLGLVGLPSRLVESAIAASIAYVAIENLTVRAPEQRWRLAFGFGLVHGLGFASALGEIGLPRAGLAVSLLGFNVGVELGQLAVVLLAVPLLLLPPRLGLPAYRLRQGGSLVLLVLSLFWLAERAFGRALLGGRLG